MAVQDYLRNGGINPQRPNQPAPALQQDPMRQAVMEQLAPAPQPTASSPGSSSASPVSDRFSRGGQVKELPKGDMAGRVANMGASTATNIAGRALGNTAAGAATGAGINVATGALADRVRTKEEMPTFGGEFGHITDEMGRRFQTTGGGTKAGAIRGAGYGANPALVAATGGLSVLGGAAIGAGIAAAKRHAPSAFSDFRVEDAADAIAKAYQEYLGRPASDDEIESQLVGQGWNPTGGDRWVGEKGLNFVLGQIKNSPEAQQRATRGAVMEQLAGSAGAGAPVAGIPGNERPTQGAGMVAGAAPAAAATTPGSWNTDGYATPQVTAQNFRGQAPPGWDQTKWNDPNHQTPKYVWGRLTQDDNPNDVDQLLAAYPGSTFNGKDKVTIPGVGTIDIYRGASAGLNEPQWLAEDGGGAQPAQGSGGSAQGAGVDTSAAAQTPTVDAGTLDKIRAELERIIAGQPSRDALLAQLGT